MGINCQFRCGRFDCLSRQKLQHYGQMKRRDSQAAEIAELLGTESSEVDFDDAVRLTEPELSAQTTILKTHIPITEHMKSIIAGLALMVGTAVAASAADVEANWNKHCASCHGKDGSGDTKMGKKSGAKDYRDPKVQAEIKPDEALKNVKAGMKEDGKEKMKPFADKLSDDEIKELITYIKKFEKK